MEHLWTPWRMEYIMKGKKAGCIFCDAIEKEDGIENLVVFRAEHAFVILNRYPYTTGHIMVVPYLHKATLEELTQEIRSEIIEIVSRFQQVLLKEYHPEGFNLGVNIGKVAGAGVLDHVHFHIVPRWEGDTNFMSSLAGTRVLPEHLQDTYLRIKKAWQKFPKNK